MFLVFSICLMMKEDTIFRSLFTVEATIYHSESAPNKHLPDSCAQLCYLVSLCSLCSSLEISLQSLQLVWTVAPEESHKILFTKTLKNSKTTYQVCCISVLSVRNLLALQVLAVVFVFAVQCSC